MMVRREYDTECKHVAERARVLAFTPDDDFAVFRKALADTVEALPEGLAGLRHVVGNIIQRVVAATEHLLDFCLSLSPPPDHKRAIQNEGGCHQSCGFGLLDLCYIRVCSCCARAGSDRLPTRAEDLAGKPSAKPLARLKCVGSGQTFSLCCGCLLPRCTRFDPVRAREPESGRQSGREGAAITSAE